MIPIRRKYLKKYQVWLFFMCLYFNVNAQDTTAIVKDFNKVLAFAVQPYLYYKSTTKMEATPLLQTEDTVTIKGEYYKNETNIYSTNSIEDIYLEDSFYVEINHNRKTIIIRKVDVATKVKMNQLPLDDKTMQDLFRKNYTVSRNEINKNTGKINFETVQKPDSLSTITMLIGLEYDTKMYLPVKLIMSVVAKQQIEEENVQELQNQGTVTKDLIQKEGDIVFMKRIQKMTMSFESIDNSKQKVAQMPSWKTELFYDIKTNDFTVKNLKYTDYEITRSF